MRKLFLCILGLLITASACYADVYSEMGLTPYFTLKAEARVYAASDIAADSFVCAPGAKISVVEYTDGGKIDGRFTNWYKVRYLNGGEDVTGYMRTPDSLQNEAFEYKETHFTYTTDVDEENYTATVELKAVKNAQVIGSCTMHVYPEAVNNVVITALSGHGLDGVDFVIKMYLSGEMCGVPIYEYYYAWAGAEFVTLPEAITMGGEGIETSYAESVILPANGAPWGTIIKTVATYEPVGGEDSYETKDDFAAQFYRWQGKEAVPYQQTPTILNWRDKEAAE